MLTYEYYFQSVGVGGGAKNEEGNDSARNFVTGLANLGLVKDYDIVVLGGVREDKGEEVSPSGPGLSFCYKTYTCIRCRSTLSVLYGIKYSTKANPCTLLDVPELIHMVNHDLHTSPYKPRMYGGRACVGYCLRYPFMGRGVNSFHLTSQLL